jgi:hypothetical protein
MKNLFFVFALLFSCSAPKNGEVIYDILKKVVIRGKIVDSSSAVRKITIYVNRIGFGQEEMKCELGNDGSFKFEFDTYIPTDIEEGQIKNYHWVESAIFRRAEIDWKIAAIHSTKIEGKK